MFLILSDEPWSNWEWSVMISAAYFEMIQQRNRDKWLKNEISKLGKMLTILTDGAVLVLFVPNFILFWILENSHNKNILKVL